MSVSLSAMKEESRQVQRESAITTKRQDKLQSEEVTLSATETFKDFVNGIHKSLQNLLKKGSSEGSSAPPNVAFESDQACKEKEPTMNTASITRCTIGRRRVASAPIAIPTKDRYGNRYPVYERKELEYI